MRTRQRLSRQADNCILIYNPQIASSQCHLLVLSFILIGRKTYATGIRVILISGEITDSGGPTFELGLGLDVFGHEEASVPPEAHETA